MTNLRSAILDDGEKKLLREAIYLFVTDLQRKYYKQQIISTEDYENQMKTVSEIVEVLHLSNFY